MDTKRPNMEPIDFEVKTHVKFGEGISKNTAQYVSEMGYDSALIVIDKNVLDTELGEKIVTSFKNDVDIVKYYFGEPTYALLEAYRNKANDCDCIVGIGGGSVIDFSKGLALLSTNNNKAISYRGFPKKINRPLPVIAIPTTSGTGSEVTYNAVFIDTDSKKKLGINTKDNFPILSILDPLFLVDCPYDVLVSTGMDGLVHSIESFSTKKANFITRPLSIIGFEYIMSSLYNISKKERDITYLSSLIFGSYFSGMALMNSGSGPTGALSYILGTHFNVPHGIAGATFLPHIIKHNEEERFDYQTFFTLKDSLSNIVFDLCRRFKINTTSLRQFDVDEKNIHILLEEIKTLEAAFNQNPVPFSVNDAKCLLESMVSE